ncbi:hypothetical protein [Tenacibaculum sp. 190524A05c]|uniref:Uncharacterized protein n=1 Tax=Tenacibaculum platacis TaxID=3137852 RepID=A0ABM9P3T4_9FLAO
MKKSIYHPKRSAILIILLFISGMLIGKFTQRFRFSEYRWIYQFGSLLNILVTTGSLLWSLIHPLMIWSEDKKDWKKHLLWMIIGMVPFLYLVIALNF